MRSLFGFFEGYDTPPPERVTAYLVRRHYANGSPMRAPDWMIVDNGWWMDIAGERWEKRSTDVVIRTQDVLNWDWESIDWHGSSLLWDEAPAGWLAPDGTWYGCLMLWHEVVARLVLHLDGDVAIQIYAHVHGKTHVYRPTLTERFTPAQAAWLVAHGCQVGEVTEHEKKERAEWERGRNKGRPCRTGD